MAIRRKLIQKKAEQVLAICKSSKVPVDVEALAQKLGVTVVTDHDTTDDISGFFMLDGGQPIIGVNGQHPETRRRFTIAHELGHFVLHRPSEGVAHVDKSLHVKFRNADSSSGEYEEEVEANLFAAELLMPSEQIQKSMSEHTTFDVDDRDNKIRSMAAEFNVSEQALLIRLSSLGYI